MHLTDDQLNEYLDKESSERPQIESHLAECGECAARLTALQALFDEIESLPEVELTRSISARRATPYRAERQSPWDAASFTRPSNLPAPLPRWLTLTATLQAALAFIAIFFTVPIVSRYLTPVLQTVSVPSFRDVLIEIQMYFVMWLQTMQAFQIPAIPTGFFTLPEELSPTLLSISLLGLFIVWLIGNWWLLRKRPNPLA
jgi:hypothetical protein